MALGSAPRAELLTHRDQLAEVVGVVVRDEEQLAEVRLPSPCGIVANRSMDSSSASASSAARSSRNAAMRSSHARADGGSAEFGQ
jgi:hypothetical protein